MSPSNPGSPRETIGTKVVLLVTFTGAAFILLIAAVALWGMSALRLHSYGEESVLTGWIGRVMLPAIGFWDVHPGAIAWALPAGIDFAGLALSVVIAVMAFMYGHPMTPLRVMLVLVTGVSAMINRWETPILNGDGGPKFIATIIPLLAVLTFEGFVYALRKLHELRTGKAHARIHPARWLFDFRGTWDIVRARVLAIPLPGEDPDETVQRVSGPAAAPVPVYVRRTLAQLVADVLDAARRSLAAEPVRVIPLPLGHDSARPGPAALARPGTVADMLALTGPARPGQPAIASPATPAEAFAATTTAPAEAAETGPAATLAEAGPAQPNTTAQDPAATVADHAAEAGPARPGQADATSATISATPASTDPADPAAQVTARPQPGPALDETATYSPDGLLFANVSGPARPGQNGTTASAENTTATRPGLARPTTEPGPADTATLAHSSARPGPAEVSSDTESGRATAALEETRPMPRLVPDGPARPGPATPIEEQAPAALVEAAVSVWIDQGRQVGRDGTLAQMRRRQLSVPHNQRKSLMEQAARMYAELAQTG